MTIAHKSNVSTGYSPKGPLTKTVSANNGDTIIFTVQCFTDTLDGTVTSNVAGDVVTTDVSGTTNHAWQVFHVKCASSGTDPGSRTVTWTAGNSPTFGCWGDVAVFSAAGDLSVDVAASIKTISTATGTPTTNSTTPTGTGRLLIAGFNGDNGSYTVGTPTNSFTDMAQDVTNTPENIFSYRIYTSSTAISTGWTIASHTDTGSSLIIAYKEAAGAGSLNLTKQRGATTLAAARAGHVTLTPTVVLTKQRGATSMATARFGHLVVTTSRPPGLRGATTIAAGRLGQQAMRYPTGRAVSLATARAGHVTTAVTVLNLTKQRGAMSIAAARAGTLHLTTYGYRLLTGLRGAVSSTAGRVGVLTRNNRMLPAQRGATSLTDSRLGVAFLSNNAAITVLVRAEDHVSVTIREES